ncbi:DUF2125 domain-containing protein [Palleronia abyssalis]|uniref:DUF2125 domain-containing protein n=1 Tax=Palleronia abyssalis TaxID=1501240 RepID=A0A2R8BTI1_9RHOB|nr:DUF2125 domain-containing protein [Palleronia abyssalis]SPJ23461.1 hypothetical protein PAA8504_01272 [Palleronia abyssalis]
MSPFRYLPPLVLCLAGAPALAAVTPEALWQSWQDDEGAISAVGTVSRDGETLTVTDARLTIEDVTAEIARLVLSPEGEGTRAGLPDDWRLVSDDVSAEVTAPGASLLATGDAADPVYRMAAPQMTVATDIDDQPVTIDMVGLAGLFASDALDLEADSLRLVADATEDGPAVTVERTSPAFTLAGPIQALADLVAGEVPPDAVIELTSTESLQVFTPAQENAATVTIRSGATRDAVEITGGTLAVQQSLQDVAIAADGPSVPLPDASAAIESVELALTGPAAPTDAPAPFSVAMSMDGLTASEQLWQLIDPAAALSRSPANLALELSGQTLRTGTAEMAPERAALEAFRLEALGAVLMGQGSLLFQTPGEGALGKPVGTFSFTLEGALGVLDRLDELGTLPTGALIGARMGLGMFTRPGEGDDSLESTINIGPQGAVSVNGRVVMQLP